MKRCWWVAALACMVALQPLAASTFMAQSVGELVEASAAILEGEVLRVESYWEATGSIIVTEALVQVRDLIAGDAPSVVRVKTFGGTVDGYTIEAFGFPRFAKGERVVLFLEADREIDMMRVAGYQQGQWRIERDERGIEKAISAVDSGASLVAADGRPVDHPRQLLLAALKDRIRAEASRHDSGPITH